MLSNWSCLASDRSSVMTTSNTLFNERRENLFKENIPASNVQGKSSSVSVSQTKIWWQSSKAFQKVNYVTCSLVLWKYTFGVICTKMLQIQKKICFKVNNFFYASLKKRNVVYIIFLIKVTASYELSIAAHFFIVLWPAFKKIRLYIFVTKLREDIFFAGPTGVQCRYEGYFPIFYWIFIAFHIVIDGKKSTINVLICFVTSERKHILVATDLFITFP